MGEASGGRYWSQSMATLNQELSIPGSNEPMLFVLEALCHSFSCMVPTSAPGQSIVLGTASASPPPPPSNQPTHPSRAGPIAGGIIGSVIAIALMIGLVLAYRSGKLQRCTSAHAAGQPRDESSADGYAVLSDDGATSLNSRV